MLNAVKKQEAFHTVELLFLKKKTNLKKPTKPHFFFFFFAMR